MRVEALMTHSPITVGMDATLESILDIFNTNSIHHLIVIENHKVAGIISDRDVLRAISPFAGTNAETRRDAFTLHKKAHQVMSRKVISVTEGDDIKTAAMLILDNNISCLPVLGKLNKLIGILSWRDLMRFALSRNQ